MASKADCNLDETVVVTVNWGTVEKSDLVNPVSLDVPEAPVPVVAATSEPTFLASPATPPVSTSVSASASTSVLEQEVHCSPCVGGVKAGFDWKPSGSYDTRSRSCLLQEEITVVCHQGVMEKNSHALAGGVLGFGGGGVADTEEKVDGPPGSGKKDFEAGPRSEAVSTRSEKIGKWDVAVERKRLVKKEARDNGVVYGKTWHSEVAKCSKPGLAGDEPLALLERKYQMQTLSEGDESDRSESLVERVETLQGSAVVASYEVGTWMLKPAAQISQSKANSSASGKKEGLPLLRKIFSAP